MNHMKSEWIDICFEPIFVWSFPFKKEREKKIRPTQKIKYIPNNFFCDKILV